MAWWPLTSLVAALVAAVIGFGGLAGDASWVARSVFFLALALYTAALAFGPKGPRHATTLTPARW